MSAFSNLQPREKRLLIIWPIAMAVFAAIYFWPSDTSTAQAAERYTDIPSAEQRLSRLRQIAASIPAREQVREAARKELATREQDLARATTPAQEQANLLQTVRRLARGQMIDLQSSEVGRIEAFGKEYGEAQVTVTFTCRVEQLVNLVADISAQKELVATRELQVRQADEKRKTVSVRMTVSAVVPKEMLGQAKGGA